jgi:hypothetical protein
MSLPPPVLCFKCPICESWHSDLPSMKQHMQRRHKPQQIFSTDGLESNLCTQSGPRRTFVPIGADEVNVAPDNFRTQSLFAQRSMFGVATPTIDVPTLSSYFPPKTYSALVASIRKEVSLFLVWIGHECSQEWSCDLRNRMSEHGFKPIQPVSHSKYAQTLTAFCFFCRHCPWAERPANVSVGNILWSAFAESKIEIRMMYMVEKFFLYSYHCMGRGPTSRDLSLISADCAVLKYGLRGGYLHHCLQILQNNDVPGFNEASRHFMPPGAFSQLTNLKRIADSCKPSTTHQPISWVEGSEFSSLTVLSVGIILTHSSIQRAFEKVLEFVGAVMESYEVPNLCIEQLKSIRDSPTSTHAGEGLVSFNAALFPERDIWLTTMRTMNEAKKKDFYNDSFACANHIVVGLHLSAGPGFRGTEDASILLVNSMSQAPRNLRAIGRGNHLQFCIIPDYCKQRPLSMKQPSLVAKFLPVPLAILLVRYMFLMKTLEGLLSDQGKNCSTFLVTNCGRPVDASTYNQVLNGMFRSLGLNLDLSDLRHALEAFARHLPHEASTHVIRNRLMANHGFRSSSNYGRDDFTVAEIDADMLEQDEVASYLWNTIILKSSNRLSDNDGDGSPPAKKRALCSGSSRSVVQQSSLVHDTPSQMLNIIAVNEQTYELPVLLPKFYSSLSAKSECSLADQQSSFNLPLSSVQQEAAKFLKSVTTDSAVIMPTGSGKTRLIQYFGGCNDGVSVVISPFEKLTVQMECVLGESAFRWPLKECSETRCLAQAKFIVVAIEHCEYNSRFVQFLRTLHQRRGVARLFVDEVHHLLEGEKPEFRACLTTFWMFRCNLITFGVHAPVVGLTATLRQNDVCRLRKLISGSEDTMPVFRQSCYRSNIHFELVWEKNGCEAQRLCIQDSLSIATTSKTVVFGTSVRIVCYMAEKMKCQAVTSGIALDLDKFQKTKLIVASSCAGHGLDLRDIRAVCILGVPFDAETLIQWAGRIRESGTVKLFLDLMQVTALSKLPDRRGELARLILKCKNEGRNIQDACCHVIDSGICDTQHEVGMHKIAFVSESLIDNTQQTQHTQPSAAPNLQKIVELKVKIRAFFSSFPMQYCKVCYLLGDRTSRNCSSVCRSFAGICIRCFQRHSYKDCTAPRFVMPGKTLCQKCYLPYLKGVGPDMHPCPIGAQCASQVCEALPQAAFILFYSKSSYIPSELHGNFNQFVSWLHSIDGATGLHGILTLLGRLIP